MMKEEIKNIFSENPINDQWQILLRFAYSNNIKKYLNSRSISNYPDILPEIVSNSFQQAYEYFNAAKIVSLNISPLLIYYGTSNLLLATSNLFEGKLLSVENHGMQLIIPDKLNRIADVEIKLRDPSKGAFSVFNNTFSNNKFSPNGEKWFLLESLGAILELKDDFENVYEDSPGFAIPIQVIIKKNEKFWLLENRNLSRFNNTSDIFSLVPEFYKNYLTPTKGRNNFIIRKRLNGLDLSEMSISGESFFSLVQEKNNKQIKIPLVSKIFIGLYALGFLSRYHPEIWSSFIKTDSTGEKQIIEKFLDLSKRYIPNICLNFLYNKKFIFLDQINNTLDISDKAHKEELREIIREEIQLFLKESEKRR